MWLDKLELEIGDLADLSGNRCMISMFFGIAVYSDDLLWLIIQIGVGEKCVSQNPQNYLLLCILKKTENK